MVDIDTYSGSIAWIFDTMRLIAELNVRRLVMTLVVAWSGLVLVEGNFQLNDFVESSMRKQPGKVCSGICV